MHPAPLAFLLCVVLLLSACGGGGGAARLVAEALAQTVPPIDPDVVGTLSANGRVIPDRLYMGDTPNDVWRACFGFDLQAPPAGRTLTWATLVLGVKRIHGDPSRLGRIMVTLLELGDRLRPTAYGQRGIGATMGPSAPFAADTVEMDVTLLVQDVVARGRSEVDIRLAFEVRSSGDDSMDGLEFSVLGLRLDWE